MFATLSQRTTAVGDLFVCFGNHYTFLQKAIDLCVGDEAERISKCEVTGWLWGIQSVVCLWSGAKSRRLCEKWE